MNIKYAKETFAMLCITRKSPRWIRPPSSHFVEMVYIYLRSCFKSTKLSHVGVCLTGLQLIR